MTLLAMALKNFFYRRLTFAAHLQNSSSGLTTSRYLRLMSMSVVQMVWAVLVTSLDMWFSCQHGLRPWISWENVHSGFSQIAYFPTVLIPRESLRWTYALWWTVPFSALLFVSFFAFGEETVKGYRKILQWTHWVFPRRTGAKNEASFAKYVSSSIPRLLLISMTVPPPLTIRCHTSKLQLQIFPWIFLHFPSLVPAEKTGKLSSRVTRRMFSPIIRCLAALSSVFLSQVHHQLRTNDNGVMMTSLMWSDDFSVILWYLQSLFMSPIRSFLTLDVIASFAVAPKHAVFIRLYSL